MFVAVRIIFSVWLVSGYAHVFVIVSVIPVRHRKGPPSQKAECNNTFSLQLNFFSYLYGATWINTRPTNISYLHYSLSVVRPILTYSVLINGVASRHKYSAIETNQFYQYSFIITSQHNTTYTMHICL